MTAEALAANKDVRGASHENTVNMALNLANQLGSLGHHDRAVELLNQARTFSVPVSLMLLLWHV